MKKKILVAILAATMALSITACRGSEQKEEETKTESAEEAEPEKEEVTYQSILDEYTQKIIDATPGLVEEYNTEAADKAGDVNALAELSNSKVEKLAEISNDGVEKMAELMTKNGDEYDTYEEWAAKLTDVYMQQSQQITDAYMASATGQ